MIVEDMIALLVSRVDDKVSNCADEFDKTFIDFLKGEYANLRKDDVIAKLCRLYMSYAELSDELERRGKKCAVSPK